MRRQPHLPVRSVGLKTPIRTAPTTFVQIAASSGLRLIKPKKLAAETDGVIRDVNGNALTDGDAVILIKDLKVKGSSIVLKKGTKVKSIRLPQGAGDHEVDCKTDQGGFMLKACFLKKA